MSIIDINEQAADWLLRLHENDLDASELARFDAWKQADAQHAAALERMQGFVAQMQVLRQQKVPARAALSAGRRRVPRGKRSVGALLLVLALAVPIGLLVRSQAAAYWLADLRTAPAQWQTRTLADQSQISLAGNSAVDLHFDDRQRRVELRRGEILVDVAHDADRPFIVATEQGEIRALGTRFLVKRENGSTLLTMLESRVAANAAQSSAITEVSAGEQARISPDHVQLLAAIDSASVADAWQHRQLVVQDQPLTAVLDELAQQRGGYVHFDRAALAGLRVSAVLPLDDSDRALQLIGDALPVDVQRITPWLVVVKKR